MKQKLLGLMKMVVLLTLFGFPSELRARDWKIVFEDNFNGSRGAAPDPAKWTAEIGGGGWGNQELQYYTDATENLFADGLGSLIVRAAELNGPSEFNCWYGPCRYTSGRIVTKSKFELKFGKVEARIKIPYGQGIWPAFWMLGNNIGSVGWPECGEIDIMENIGREPALIHGTIHGPGYSGQNGIGGSYTLPNRKNFAADFHIYSIEWTAGDIRWYVDGKLYQTKTPKNLPKGSKWVFDHPFFLILNLAVGGSWPGSPDETTTFPQTMMVDYVRAYSWS